MTSGLRRFLRPPPPGPRPGEQCELCSEPIDGAHSHVVDVETRNLVCACRGCYLLFTRSGAGGGRFQAVPDRFRYLPNLELSDAVWESIGIPVRMAFFFRNSALDKTVAFYPSPAGATESLLPLEPWEQLLAANPELAELTPDVEALLVNRRPDGFECFLVPIAACYELVGLVRVHWRGFDGGTEAWEHINGFFAALRQRAGRAEPDDG